MKQINLKEMYDAGVHLGSSVKKLNPKMKPYIMCTHDGIAIIDILKTYTRLFRIIVFLKKVIATEGYRVLFVGTQKSIAPLIAEIATKSSSPYINERWKGGFLTNFKTMKGQNSSKSIKDSSVRRQFSIGDGRDETSQTLKMFGSSPRKDGNTNIENSEKGNTQLFGARPNLGRDSTKELSDELFFEKSPTFLKKNVASPESNELNSLPDLVIIVGQEKELKAIKECQKLNIPTITILDSDGDPEKTSLFIPANDDSRSSVEFILKHLGESILISRLLYEKKTRATVSKKVSRFKKSRNVQRV